MSPSPLRAALPLIAIMFLSACQGAKGTPGRTGEEGQQGPAGLDGATGAQGLVWRGAWASGISYAKDDAVSHLGAAWIANAANTGTAPPSASWDLLAEKGAPGVQGPEGLQGPRGPAGGAVWRDATGAYVGPVLSTSMYSSNVKFVGPDGNWWTLVSSETPVVTAPRGLMLWYTTADCSGTAYYSLHSDPAPMPKAVVRNPDDDAKYLVRPLTAPTSVVDLVANRPSSTSACLPASLVDEPVVAASALVEVQAPTVTFVAPLYIAPE